ncbi:MAG TPA: hypothetical protein VHC90_21105 [Bryobacteraceae bacterium]|nr:hypothetical protein [Bryobacteraceae bacterium]
MAEPVGNIVITCTGGNSGSVVNAIFSLTLNTNITNTLDSNGFPENVTVTSTGAPISFDPPALASSSSLQITNLQYTVPPSNLTPVIITIGGIRANVAMVQGGQAGTIVNGTLVGIGAAVSGPTFPVAIGNNLISASVQNSGLPCSSPKLPDTIDFDSFIAGGIPSSAVRVTENVAAAFSPQAGGATNGFRVIVQLNGFGAGTRLWIPNAIVGNSGSGPTSAGQFATSIAGGTYTPNANQLLLSLVTGADANGAGGTLAFALPGGGTSFEGLTELSVANGSAYAVYEVLDDSPYVAESFQVPVFILPASSSCSGIADATLTVMAAPVSTVAVASPTAPVPRYISSVLGSDCQQAGDCNQAYFPVLSIDTTPISFTGASQGLSESTTIALLNNGGSVLSYSTSITYQSGSGWLSVTPNAANVPAGRNISIAADPSSLQAGTYTATVNIDAGEAGKAAIPVTFTVGPSGPVIRAIVNAASYQNGITPGSYVALYGSDLAGASVQVTFSGTAATVIPVPAPYNQTQINLIVPAALTPQSGVSVVANIDGKTSNTFSQTVVTNAPGIFTPGILNSDNSVNGSAHPAVKGSFVQVYLTGMTIPLVGTLSVTMGGQAGIIPLPGQTYSTVLPALNQVNVVVPASLVPTGDVPLSVCIAALPGVAPICSNSVDFYVQ